MRPARRIAGALLLFFSSGCGGSGGGTALFRESFHAVGIGGDASPVPEGRAFWGTADFDGFAASFVTSSNVNGTVSGPVAEPPLPFAIEGDGTLRLFDPATFEEVLRGGVAVGGSAATLGRVRAGDVPGIVAMTRRWTSPASVADLSGTFHSVVFNYEAGSATSIVAQLAFDGAGGGSAGEGYVLNTDGEVLAGLRISTNLTYAVDADGGVTITAGFGRVFRGGLHESRDLVVLAGSSNVGPPTLILLLRVSAASSAATFSGTYRMAGVALDYATPAFRSFTGLAVADGAGSATVEGTTDEEGSITDDPPAAVTYTVAADGTLLLSTPDGDFKGGVSPGGQFAVLGGSVTGGSDPAVYTLAR